MSLALIDVIENSYTMRHFLDLPGIVYGDDIDYCRPFRGSLLSSVLPGPSGGRQRILVVLDDGRPAARVVARICPTAAHRGTLGFFESLDRKDAAAMLLDEAVRWLIRSGARRIFGPMDSDTWHNYRVNLGPFGVRPFLMEPYNPPYYPALWENCGFKVFDSYYSKRINDIGPVLQALEPVYRETLAKGYTLRPASMRAFDRELKLIYDLSHRIFAGSPLFSPLPQDAFVALYRGFRRLIDGDLIWFALAPDGRHIGFLFCTRDLFAAVRVMRGRRTPLSLIAFMLEKRSCESVNFKTLGVLPEYRSQGIATTLMCQGYRKALEKGYRKVNLCLIREGNYSGNLDCGKGEIMRRYALYECTERAC
jgi:GNAT superfamily N-acetyltransferase